MATHHRRSNVRVRLHGRRGALRLALDREVAGLDHRLAALAAEVIAGRPVECPWTAFRIVHFPNMDDLEAAGELGEWARRSQYPLAALMVAYTMLSLWILAQPIVTPP